MMMTKFSPAEPLLALLVGACAGCGAIDMAADRFESALAFITMGGLLALILALSLQEA